MKRKTKSRAAPFALSTLITVFVAFVAFVVIGSSTAAPSGAAKYDFFAGQTTDVGDIFVWNNATTLFVEIDMASGWCMTESHVQASTLAAIPKTKTGNPIPGKFAYGDTYSPCDNGDKFDIPLAGLGTTTPTIAVHAAVWGGLTTVDAASDTTADTVSGPLTAYFAPANAAWPAPVSAVEPTFASSGVWPTVAGAKWISTALATEPWADTEGDWIHFEAYGLARQAKFSFDGNGGEFDYDDANGNDYGVTLTDGFFSGNTGYACGTVDSGNFIGEKLLLKVTDAAIDLVWGSFVGGDPCADLGTVNPADGPFDVTSGNIRFGNDSWRWHRTVLTIPGGTLPIAGSVTAATSDNAERVWHNTSVIGNDGEVEGAFIDNQEWGTVNAYPFTPVIGANTLDFVWRNYGVPGLPNASNPNGLIYKAQVSYYTRSESAWAGTGVGTIQFSGANWATYITYTVVDVDCVNGTGVFIDGTTTLTINACEGIVGGSANWVRVSGGFENDFSGPAVVVNINPITGLAEVTIEIESSTNYPNWVGWRIEFTVTEGSPDSVEWTWVTGDYAGGSASAAIGSGGFTITG